MNVIITLLTILASFFNGNFVVRGAEIQYYLDVNCTKSNECDGYTMCTTDKQYNCSITWDGTIDTDDLADCDCRCGDIDTVEQAQAVGATCLSDGACFIICNYDDIMEKGVSYTQNLNGNALNAAVLPFDEDGVPGFPCDVGLDARNYGACTWLYTTYAGDGIGDGNGAGDIASALYWIW
jgi:hypothetical protein